MIISFYLVNFENSFIHAIKMKAILVFLWIWPLIGFAKSALVEFEEALSNTDITDCPAPSTPGLGEPIFDPSLLGNIRNLAVDRKEKLAAQLTRIIPQIAEERAAQLIQSSARDEHRGENSESLMGGFKLLANI